MQDTKLFETILGLTYVWLFSEENLPDQSSGDPRWLESAAQTVRTIFGEAALVQRCQVHKTRNILEYLSDRDRPRAHAILRRASQATEMKTAQRLLLDLARRLEPEYPSAAQGVREGLDETLTILA